MSSARATKKKAAAYRKLSADGKPGSVQEAQPGLFAASEALIPGAEAGGPLQAPDSPTSDVVTRYRRRRVYPSRGEDALSDPDEDMFSGWFQEDDDFVPSPSFFARHCGLEAEPSPPPPRRRELRRASMDRRGSEGWQPMAEDDPMTIANKLQDFASTKQSVNTCVYLHMAAACIRDCLLGSHFDFRERNVGLYRWYRSRRIHGVITATVCLNMLLSLFHSVEKGGANESRTVDPILTFLEIWCLFVFACQAVVQFKFLGAVRFVADRTCIAQLVCVAVFAFDLFFMPLFWGSAPFTLTVYNSDAVFLRLWLRPAFLLIHFGALTDTCVNMLKTARALLPVVMFICIFLVLFAVYGFMLFRNNNTHFASFQWSLYQFLIGLTTANFPDLMLPSYAQPWSVSTVTDGPTLDPDNMTWVTHTEIRAIHNGTKPFDFSWLHLERYAAPLFFVVFYLIGLYFLMSIAFAVVYRSYRRHLQLQVLSNYDFRQRMLMKAYKYLLQHIDEGYDEFNRRMDSLHSDVKDLIRVSSGGLCVAQKQSSDNTDSSGAPGSKSHLSIQAAVRDLRRVSVGTNLSPRSSARSALTPTAGRTNSRGAIAPPRRSSGPAGKPPLPPALQPQLSDLRNEPGSQDSQQDGFLTLQPVGEREVYVVDDVGTPTQPYPAAAGRRRSGPRGSLGRLASSEGVRASRASSSEATRVTFSDAVIVSEEDEAEVVPVADGEAVPILRVDSNGSVCSDESRSAEAPTSPIRARSPSEAARMEVSHRSECVGADTETLQEMLHGFREQAEDRRRKDREVRSGVRNVISALSGRRKVSSHHSDAVSCLSTTSRRSRGVDQYIFTLLYNELFPPSQKKNSEREIVPGSRVRVVQTVITDGKVIPRGQYGVVEALSQQAFDHGMPGATVTCNGVTFNATSSAIAAVDGGLTREKHIRALFHALDLDESKLLNQRQFRALYQLMQLKVTVSRDARPWAEKHEALWDWMVVRAIVRFGRSVYLQRLIDLCILGSVFFMAFHFQYMETQGIKPKSDDMDQRWFTFMYIELAIGFIFDMEVVIKVFSWGWEEYWHKKWNRFDFSITAINTCIYFVFLILAMTYGAKKAVYMVMEVHTATIDETDSTPDVIMIVLLGRLLRTLRVVSNAHQPFRYLLKTLGNIAPVLGWYVVAVIVVFFLWASIGMHTMGHSTPPPSTAYSQLNYYALNFESFYGALITLWCLMIVNNWFVIVDGYRAAVGESVLVFFVSFYCIGVILLMNVVTAFVVELWDAQWALNKKKHLNIANHPLAQRVHSLNQLQEDLDGNRFYELGLFPNVGESSRPVWKVKYGNYAHKVQLAMEQTLLNQKGVRHILEGQEEEAEEIARKQDEVEAAE